LAKLDANYDPGDKIAAMAYLQGKAAQGELVTGLIYMERGAGDLHVHLNTVDRPLNVMSEKELCPGAAALEGFNASHR
jgi:2-oxoglutarate/2-oxoacid ferredoxin oxidoreductase subunit beta